MSRQLKALGFTVTAVANGDEAFARLQEGACDFDLLLTDLVLPGNYRGDQLVEIAREECSEIGILLVSGYPLAPDDALENVPCLTKPVSLKDLVQAIEKVLG
jgi:CheY-like chemotaxis protein